jgi:hypothetical protein
MNEIDLIPSLSKFFYLGDDPNGFLATVQVTLGPLKIRLPLVHTEDDGYSLSWPPIELGNPCNIVSIPTPEQRRVAQEVAVKMYTDALKEMAES